MRRLLILSCSLRKRPAPGLLPAVERYDGPAFRVLRRYLRTGPRSAPAVYVLSAELGLIPGEERIPWYDRRMTPERAAELRPAVAAVLDALLDPSRPELFDQALISMGNDYLAALSLHELVDSRPGISVARGRPGTKLAILKSWLHAAETAG
jgi:hypothetical protein